MASDGLKVLLYVANHIGGRGQGWQDIDEPKQRHPKFLVLHRPVNQLASVEFGVEDRRGVVPYLFKDFRTKVEDGLLQILIGRERLYFRVAQ